MTDITKNYKLEGLVFLKSPLSHIGESLGIDSYLAEQKIIGEDGRPVECFVYSGNAFRGMLRDLATKYLLEKLGNFQIPAESFHLLFSGGTLGGKQNLDIEQARKFRKLLPAFSIFGGGVGNQIMAGKMNIGQAYPVVKETARIVPEKYHLPEMQSWRHWTMEQSFTRKDDSKDENLRKYLKPAIDESQLKLTGESTKEKKKDNDKEPAQQMRYTVELLSPGSIMYQRIDLKSMTELELGAFVSGLVEFSKHPYLGGKANVGMGLVEIDYKFTDNPFKPAEDEFMKIGQDQLHLSEPAQNAKEKYDAFLLDIYNNYIDGKETELKELLAE
jgi:CRISPR type IV-associated protein Csf2